MATNPKALNAQIRTVRFLPQDLELTPSNPSDLVIKDGVNLSLSALFGLTEDGGRRVDATLCNCLKVACYGSGYTKYGVKSGTAPIAYTGTHALTVSSGFYQRWDFLIETQEAEITFYDDVTLTWGSSIPLTVGNHSIEFVSSACRIKYRSVAGCTYTMVGYR